MKNDENMYDDFALPRSIDFARQSLHITIKNVDVSPAQIIKPHGTVMVSTGFHRGT